MILNLEPFLGGGLIRREGNRFSVEFLGAYTGWPYFFRPSLMGGSNTKNLERFPLFPRKPNHEEIARETHKKIK